MSDHVRTTSVIRRLLYCNILELRFTPQGHHQHFLFTNCWMSQKIETSFVATLLQGFIFRFLRHLTKTCKKLPLSHVVNPNLDI